MNNEIFVFDRNLVKKRRNRAAPYLSEHGFLFDWSISQISERLNDIKRSYNSALKIGQRGDGFDKEAYGIKEFYTLDIADKLSPNVIADEEVFPFATNSFDLVLSALNLHSINDLPGVLNQIKNSLKDDGLFIAALLGGETLHELRDVINLAEQEIVGGVSPRVAPFADMQQMGALMQRAGFNLPVIDSDKITVSYDNVFKLFKDLRLMGEGNTMLGRQKKYVGKEFFMKVAEDYSNKYAENNGRIVATFEIIFLIGWKPHESQQKPLKPGSAKQRLSNALKTEEEILSC
jgi:SAM-dependent methyltransferase